ncbi:Desiccation-related protein PCC13-62 [Nymphaea thermarum]|nr:Desiccation-related protein PCC13-62 [Nymphaea thermarum]
MAPGPASSSSVFVFSLHGSSALLMSSGPCLSCVSCCESLQLEHSIPQSDVDMLEVPLSLEFLEAELFLWGALGHGLDKVAPEMAAARPPPIGATKANLDPFTKDVITQLAYQEVGHQRTELGGSKAIKKSIAGFARPLLDLSAESFSGRLSTSHWAKKWTPFLTKLVMKFNVPF